MTATPPPTDPNIIPPMTDPLSVHWEQPDRDSILIDDTHACMDIATFKRLADYSCSIPSGTYVGKMWRRRLNFHGPEVDALLCWYAASEKEGYLDIKSRRILLIPETEDVILITITLVDFRKTKRQSAELARRIAVLRFLLHERGLGYAEQDRLLETGTIIQPAEVKPLDPTLPS